MRKKKEETVDLDLKKFIFLEKQTCNGQTLREVLEQYKVDPFILKYKVDADCSEYEIFALRDRSSFDIKKKLLDSINPKEERMFSYDTNVEDGDSEITVRFYWRALTEENLEKKQYRMELSSKEQKKADKEAKKQLKAQKKSKKRLKLEEKNSQLESDSEI